MYAQKCEGYMKLEVKDITKSFGDKQVLHGISFEVQSGRALGLLGRNGAGKTTIFNLLTGVYKPDEGIINLDGQDITGKSTICLLYTSPSPRD